MDCTTTAEFLLGLVISEELHVFLFMWSGTCTAFRPGKIFMISYQIFETLSLQKRCRKTSVAKTTPDKSKDFILDNK